VWGSFKRTASKILSCSENAPDPEPASTGQAGKVSFRSGAIFWGCAVVNFKTTLPFHNAGPGYAGLLKDPHTSDIGLVPSTFIYSAYF